MSYYTLCGIRGLNTPVGIYIGAALIGPDVYSDTVRTVVERTVSTTWVRALCSNNLTAGGAKPERARYGRVKPE